jgi:hypothetical protein
MFIKRGDPWRKGVASECCGSNVHTVGQIFDARVEEKGRKRRRSGEKKETATQDKQKHKRRAMRKT